MTFSHILCLLDESLKWGNWIKVFILFKPACGGCVNLKSQQYFVLLPSQPIEFSLPFIFLEFGDLSKTRSKFDVNFDLSSPSSSTVSIS